MTSGVTYDAGALIAAEAGRRDLWALHAAVLKRGVRNDLVVTSDVGDIVHLATALGRKLRTYAV